MRPGDKLKRILGTTQSVYRLDKSRRSYELYLIDRSDEILKLLWPADNVEEVGAQAGNDLSIEGAKLLSHARDLKRLNLNFNRCDPRSMPPESFRFIAAIPRLESFAVDYAGDIEEALTHLSTAKRLRKLCIHSPTLTDSGLRHIGAMTSLERIELHSLQLTGAGLGELNHLSALRELSLEDCNIDDRGLREIARFPLLRTLYLRADEPHRLDITDAGVGSLSGVELLEDLGLSRTKITDSSLRWISGLKGLRTLFLDGNDITDSGIVHLLGHPTLRLVCISGTKVSPQFARRLHESLLAPDAWVVHESIIPSD